MGKSQMVVVGVKERSGTFTWYTLTGTTEAIREPYGSPAKAVSRLAMAWGSLYFNAWSSPQTFFR